MKIKLVLLFVLAVLFVSGCIEGDVGEMGLLGLGEPEYTVKEEVSLDIEPVPRNVDSGRTMEVFFDLTNEGNSTVENVRARLTDLCLFDPLDYQGITFNEMESGDRESWTWEFEARDVRMEKNCDIRYTLEYDSEAHARFDVNTISEDEYYTRQEAGDLQRIGNATRYERTSGPVEISAEISEEQPIMEGDSFIVHFRFENKGEGRTRDKEIEDATLSFSDEVVEYDNCQGMMHRSGNTLSLRDPIGFRNGETTQISCRFEASEIDGVETGTFEIDIDYTYREYGKFNVNIMP